MFVSLVRCNRFIISLDPLLESCFVLLLGGTKQERVEDHHQIPNKCRRNTRQASPNSLKMGINCFINWLMTSRWRRSSVVTKIFSVNYFVYPTPLHVMIESPNCSVCTRFLFMGLLREGVPFVNFLHDDLWGQISGQIYPNPRANILAKAAALCQFKYWRCSYTF